MLFILLPNNLALGDSLQEGLQRLLIHFLKRQNTSSYNITTRPLEVSRSQRKTVNCTIDLLIKGERCGCRITKLGYLLRRPSSTSTRCGGCAPRFDRGPRYELQSSRIVVRHRRRHCLNRFLQILQSHLAVPHSSAASISISSIARLSAPLSRTLRPSSSASS